MTCFRVPQSNCIIVTATVPNIIKSDNGPAFKSKEFGAFAKEMGFIHQKSIPEHPPSNGCCERMMAPINKTIRCALAMNQNWKEQLDAFIRNYRAAIHPSTGCTPNQLMGLPDEIEIPSLNIPVSADDSMARANDAIAKERMKRNADLAQHTKTIDMSVGSKVLNHWRRKNKFQSRFDDDPYLVQSQKGSMITAVRPNHTITRDISSFKKISYLEAIIPIREIEVYSGTGLNMFFRRRPTLVVPTQQATTTTMIPQTTPPPTPLTNLSSAEISSNLAALEQQQNSLASQINTLREENSKREAKEKEDRDAAVELENKTKAEQDAAKFTHNEENRQKDETAAAAKQDDKQPISTVPISPVPISTVPISTVPILPVPISPVPISTVPIVKSPRTAAMKKCLALAKEVGLEGVVQENIQKINTESFKDTQATPDATLKIPRKL